MFHIVINTNSLCTISTCMNSKSTLFEIFTVPFINLITLVYNTYKLIVQNQVPIIINLFGMHIVQKIIIEKCKQMKSLKTLLHHVFVTRKNIIIKKKKRKKKKKITQLSLKKIHHPIRSKFSKYQPIEVRLTGIVVCIHNIHIHNIYSIQHYLCL